MPQAARRQQSYSRTYGYPSAYSYTDVPVRVVPTQHPRKRIQDALKPKKTQRKKVNPIAQFISLALLACIGYFILPVAFNDITVPLITGKQKYSNVRTNYYKMMFPTKSYLHNTIFSFI